MQTLEQQVETLKLVVGNLETRLALAEAGCRSWRQAYHDLVDSTRRLRELNEFLETLLNELMEGILN